MMPGPLADRSSPSPGRRGPIRRLLAALGPGVVTGAADDDPSGIATYSIAGAQLGTALLWTALFTWPLMAAVQMMCARIGMVTGRGLTGALRARFPRSVVVGFALALLAANTINVGADLSGMADAAEMVSGIDSHFWVLVIGGALAWATIRLRYTVIARTLKWLALVLFAYVIAAIHIHPDWSVVWRATVTPSWPANRLSWAALVAILGTTISPYLFFWQASQEVEEERSLGRATVEARIGATREELRGRRLDVGIGTFFSNVVMYAIILTTAWTLHRAGLTRIATSREAAEALRPLAGRLAAGLYTAGLLGVGILSIPTLTGSAAYALAEAFDWQEGLDRKWREAPMFYGVVVLMTLGGVAFDFFSLPPITTLFWSAVINGLLAPVLLMGILVLASDSALMARQPSGLLSRLVVGAATVLMAGAAFGLLL